MLTYYRNNDLILLEKKVEYALNYLSTSPNFYKFEGLSFDSITGVVAAAFTNRKVRNEQKKCNKELEKIFDNKLSANKMSELIMGYKGKLEKEVNNLLTKIITPPNIDKSAYKDLYKGQAVFALSPLDLKQSTIASIKANAFFTDNLKHDIMKFYFLLEQTNALTGKDESAIEINDIIPSYKVNVQQVWQMLDIDCVFNFTAEGLNEFISYAREKGTVKAVIDFNSQATKDSDHAFLFDAARTASIVNKLRSKEVKKIKTPKVKVRERDARELTMEKSKPFEITGRYM